MITPLHQYSDGQKSCTFFHFKDISSDISSEKNQAVGEIHFTKSNSYKFGPTPPRGPRKNSIKMCRSLYVHALCYTQYLYEFNQVHVYWWLCEWDRAMRIILKDDILTAFYVWESFLSGNIYRILATSHTTFSIQLITDTHHTIS